MLFYYHYKPFCPYYRESWLLEVISPSAIPGKYEIPLLTTDKLEIFWIVMLLLLICYNK